MPRQDWSDKRERQYEHIKESEKKQGRGERRAEEIAARTVNKNRAQAGEAKSSSKLSREDMSPQQRGGQRSGTAREKGRTKDQLYNEAKKKNIEGRSKMTKDELKKALGTSD
ncbi:plasmid stabilization protein [Actinocorallia sp. A-T 12471]|uniref:plasmid stabilization protein n=1 Tax=Actinocorallia sp. A-T 12471 TaxID=3089813 RepID=UPI0029D1B677|nr:plasmid stabilization protein [Actinocorallia sp. A-T 12471]MDX6739666.1 plasmid stabilization protein [Actinocorallia sp. A-T 12471]